MRKKNENNDSSLTADSLSIRKLKISANSVTVMGFDFGSEEDE